MENLIIGLVFGVIFLITKGILNQSRQKEIRHLKGESDAIRRNPYRPASSTDASFEDRYYEQRADFLLRIKRYSGVPDVPSRADAYLFNMVDFYIEQEVRGKREETRMALHRLMVDYMDILPDYLNEVFSADYAMDKSSNVQEVNLHELDNLRARKMSIEDQIASRVNPSCANKLQLIRSKKCFSLHFGDDGSVSDFGRKEFPDLIFP